VAVLGASGYTGAEVVRLSALHPNITISALTGEKQAGKVGKIGLNAVQMQCKLAVVELRYSPASSFLNQHLCTQHLQSFCDVFPHLVTATNCPTLVKIADVDYSKIDAIFCCLPHATTQVRWACMCARARAYVCSFVGVRGCTHHPFACVGVCGCVLCVAVTVTDVDFCYCVMQGATNEKSQLEVFPTLPQETLKQLPSHIKIVDLSADFRLKNTDTYTEW